MFIPSWWLFHIIQLHFGLMTPLLDNFCWCTIKVIDCTMNTCTCAQISCDLRWYKFHVYFRFVHETKTDMEARWKRFYAIALVLGQCSTCPGCIATAETFSNRLSCKLFELQTVINRELLVVNCCTASGTDTLAGVAWSSFHASSSPAMSCQYRMVQYESSISIHLLNGKDIFRNMSCWLTNKYLYCETAMGYHTTNKLDIWIISCLFLFYLFQSKK